MGKLSADDVAQYIVLKCINEGHPISNLQLQKILYFCQCEYLKKTGDPLFDDSFVAWQYGPVIPDVYRKYSLWGGNHIDWIKQSISPLHIDSEILAIINPIIEKKRDVPPWDLVSQTHTPDSPWYKTYKNGLGDGSTIPIELIMEHVCD